MIKITIRKHETSANYFQEQEDSFGSYDYEEYQNQFNLAAGLFRQRLRHITDEALELEVRINNNLIYFHNGHEEVVNDLTPAGIKEPLALRNLSSPSLSNTQTDSKHVCHSHNSGYAEKHPSAT